MADATVEVRNPSGLHARPAAAFVKAAASAPVEVRVANLSRDAAKEASAGSLLGVLSLGISRGHRIRLSAEGDGADATIAELRDLVESGLGEPLEDTGP